MEDFRCPTCGKLLCKYSVEGKGVIEIKCGRCKSISHLIVNGGDKSGKKNDS